MTVYDGEAYLREAVDSILAQTHRALELVIVDDGSKDATSRILATYTDPRLRVIRNDENIGRTRSLNRGLADTRGRYVAPQDADDRSHPERIARQLAFLETHPDAVLVGCQRRTIDDRGRVVPAGSEYLPTTPLAIEWRLLFGSPFIHSGVLFRRSVVADELGGYDDRQLISQDFELWSRLLARYPGYNLPEALIDWRAHGDSLTGSRSPEAIESQRRNLELRKAVLRMNVGRILRDGRLAVEWPEMWARLSAARLIGPPERPSDALDLIDGLHRRFVELHPEAGRDREVRRSLAALLSRVARRLVDYDRRAAARAVFRAAVADTAIGAKVAPRIAALAVGGERLRRLVHRVRRP